MNMFRNVFNIIPGLNLANYDKTYFRKILFENMPMLVDYGLISEEVETQYLKYTRTLIQFIFESVTKLQ